MSWIQRHWDRDYITLAETKVRQTVSSFALWSEISKLLPKMLEYREKAGAEGESAPTTAVPGVRTGEMPKYMSLAHQYGYDDDHMDFGHGGSNDAEQTVEQEYQAYVTAPLSKHPDILKFWEVSNVSNYVQVLTGCVGQRQYFPHHFCDGHGLPSHSSVCCPLRTSLFLECRNRYKAEELYPS